MSYLIRPAFQNDFVHLEKLLDFYMRATYQTVWSGTAEELERDALINEFEAVVAENLNGEIVGFTAWVLTYDLHHCMKGGEVIDMFVCPQNRGRGVALLMAISVASAVQKRGGMFLKGGAVDNRVVRRFYGRMAMCFPDGTSYISGRAFRHLAGLKGKSLRKIIRNLPQQLWNYEP